MVISIVKTTPSLRLIESCAYLQSITIRALHLFQSNDFFFDRAKDY